MIAGPLIESNNGGWKGDKGSPGDERPETKKNRRCWNKNQGTKLTLGYVLWQKKTTRSRI
jgi:hypothetical protein